MSEIYSPKDAGAARDPGVPFFQGRGDLTTFVDCGILWAERGGGEPLGNSGAGGVR
jgi:hypothetical protein